MASYNSSAPRSSHEEQPYYNSQPQHRQQPYHQNYQQQHQPPPNPGAMVPHPAHNPSQSYDVEPFLQPQPQQPPYSRHPSHQSYHSHHSHQSQYSHRPKPNDSDRHENDRDLERRPTLGDTLSLMWHTLVGALTRKRR